MLQVKAYLDVVVDRVECSLNSEIMDCNLKVKRIKKQRLVFGNFTCLKPFDNDVIFELTAYKKQGGEYRLMPYKIRKPICDLAREDTYFYKDICNSSTFEMPPPCPFPAKTFYVNGYTPSLKDLPLAIMPSGDYHARASYFIGDAEKARIKIWVSIIQL
jgi:Protein of unknown function (DUF1091)